MINELSLLTQRNISKMEEELMFHHKLSKSRNLLTIAGEKKASFLAEQDHQVRGAPIVRDGNVLG